MSALKWQIGVWTGTGGMSRIGTRHVAHWFRYGSRAFSRLLDGDIALPRFAATGASVALLACAGAYGAYAGGHVPAIVQAVTSRSGFAIDNIHVTGNRETSEIDILERVGLDGWTSQIGFNAQSARQRIMGLAWVQSASVRKTYPDRLDISVTEKKPFAIWQHDGQLSLVEADGSVIAPYTDPRFASLPLVVGAGSQDLASKIVAKIGRYPALAARVRGFVRVGGRRWDLTLDNGVTVKLPERDEDAAIADIVGMDRNTGLLSRDILAVDMRLNDRIVVQLTPEAETAREAMLKQRAKEYKMQERRT